jgi:enterochelin esterase family protein
VGQRNNYFYMPGAAPTPLARLAPGVPRGRLTTHVVPTYDLIATPTRRVALYQPPGEGPAPLVVVYDGPDFLRRARLPVIVENLTAQGRMRPVALAFVSNGGRRARFVEYAGSDGTLAFIDNVVLPLARQRLSLVDVEQSPGAFGVIGASMGGLMAIYTGLRRPRTFGRVLALSSALSLLQREYAAYDLILHGPPLPLRLWLAVGRYDVSELLSANRRLRNLLRRCGYDYHYREYHAGHNYPAWRDEVGRGLEWLYPA